ncbi:MAG TPA: hypothetical protein VHH12_05330, partial [Mycobacterium sp.]|nr:hypothetical protein [Mycobacterium sp.]
MLVFATALVLQTVFDTHAAGPVAVAKLGQGALWHGEHPDAEPTDGHSWSVRESTETFLEWDAP